MIQACVRSGTGLPGNLSCNNKSNVLSLRWLISGVKRQHDPLVSGVSTAIAPEPRSAVLIGEANSGCRLFSDHRLGSAKLLERLWWHESSSADRGSQALGQVSERGRVTHGV